MGLPFYSPRTDLTIRQGLSVNEFRSGRYEEGEGVLHLTSLGLFSDSAWAWYSIFAGLFIYICYFLVGVLSMHKIEHHPSINMTAGEEGVS